MADGATHNQDEDSVHDQALANLFSQYTDRIIGGEELTLEDAVQEHPEFESDLRELWGIMVVTQAAGHHQRNLLSGETEFEFAGLELPFELGDYTLEQEIGRGGMGIVYEAVRKSDGRTVAIKMILKGDFATKVEKERFRAEAEAARRLNHPNIVPIYEIGEHEGLPYFCMKLIRGHTLSEKLTRGPMLPQQAAGIMASISDAIAYAHEQGVLHRDLKPSNIILDDKGIPHLADFGLAKAISGGARASLTRTGAILGTPSYMSPEQASGSRGNVGTASDIYSLGAILYHTLTGRAPFLGATPVETVLMVIEQSPIPLRTLNQRVDRNLEMVTLRCLQKPQDLRYQSAAMLRDDLRAFLDGRSVSAREGRFFQIIANLFRETHHAEILENWGLLWMWQGLVLLVASLLTFVYNQYLDVWNYRWPYILMWTLGIGVWAIVFWMLRRRMGPVTFVERQMAHVWASAMALVIFLFPLEWMLNLEVLDLAPMLALIAAMVFLVKAGILSGQFYVHSALMCVTAIVMMLHPEGSMILFGVTSASCFFLAGLKYYRRKKQGIARRNAFLK
ncbi:serine/threonine-protein kinase [Mariniblastus fucicola]|uniref:non-specific serine/threonine protein kinase n=1 Tax=Mariniblastus fucicola TaxID=980251 RepID=A0A5B9PD47_9BACT|nr:serine/threonine-protein kinase [Mariniblastus fucicola]QEG20971.1 Serine/threonine-protein kinase PknB [Mariniblastus fucicola]